MSVSLGITLLYQLCQQYPTDTAELTLILQQRLQAHTLLPDTVVNTGFSYISTAASGAFR